MSTRNRAVVETDMRSFEDRLRDCHCHSFPVGYAVSWCGKVARSEQPVHGPHEPSRAKLRDVCPWCGQRKCPDCAAEIRKAAP